LLVSSGGGYAYLVYRRDRRKRLPLFATPLYVGGDTEILRHAWPVVAAHLLRRGLAFTLAEPRVLGFTPHGPGRQIARPRPRMHRGGPAPEDICTANWLCSPGEGNTARGRAASDDQLAGA